VAATVFTYWRTTRCLHQTDTVTVTVPPPRGPCDGSDAKVNIVAAIQIGEVKSIHVRR